MNRNITLVLTAAAAAFIFAGKPAAAQTNLSLYNQPNVASATGVNPTAAQETLFENAINAHRAALGLPAFTWNASLSNSARYQLFNEQKLNYTGGFVYLADGITKVYPLTEAADFGTPGLTLVRNAQYGNSTLISSATNFPKLESSWDALSASYDRILKDGTLTQAGFGLIQTGTVKAGTKTFPIYTWSIMAAK